MDADAIFLLILLSIPSSIHPYNSGAVCSLVEKAPLKFHRKMASAAVRLKLYNNQTQMAPCEWERIDSTVNINTGFPQGSYVHVGFYHVLRHVLCGVDPTRRVLDEAKDK